MNFEKLTIKSQEALSDAQKKAESLGHQAIENEHLLSALIAQKEGVVRPILENSVRNRTPLQTILKRHCKRYPVLKGQHRSIFLRY
jgi:ATP-dependent Clp protease ATP-binding subunit ClpB